MKKIFAVSIGFLLIVSCKSTSRLAQPSEKTAPDFKLKPFQEKTLSNGLRLLIIPDKSLPRVSFGLMVDAGSKYDPSGLAGLNAMTAALLEFGTHKRSAPAIADQFGFYGSDFNAMAGKDFSFFSTSGLSQYKENLLELFSDLVMNPAFEYKELERMKSQTIASLKKLSDNPGPTADALSEKTLYGTHPYARLTVGESATVSKISKPDLVSHYLKYYRPNRSVLAVTGDIDDQFINYVEKVFLRWKKGDQSAVAKLSAEDVNQRQWVLFTKPGLQQSQIRISQYGINRNNPDFLNLRLANLILGGSFASRLMQHVRDDLGLTYSINAGMDAREDNGYFSISTFSRNEKSAETIRESLKVFERFVSSGVTQKELDAAKALIIGQFPSAIETTDKLAYNLLILRRYGVSDSYLQEFNKNVSAIDLASVNGTIKKYYAPDRLRIVVYADQEKVLSDLKKLADFKVEAVTSSF